MKNAIASKKVKYKDYADYLKSDKWKQVKADYAAMNEHKNCVLCDGDKSLQHHHWTYPNDWYNDSFNNLIKVCKKCHDLIHSDDQVQYLSILDFMSDMISIIRSNEHENGIVIGQDDVLRPALQVLDVVETKNITNKEAQSVYRFQSGDKLSQPIRLMPLSHWDYVINGKK